MQELLKSKLEGLNEQMREFSRTLDAFEVRKNNLGDINALILNEMNSLGFDSADTDRFDNTIGVIKGYQHGRDMALLFNIDYPSPEDAGDDETFGATYKPGIVSAIYAAALLKRSLLPMVGDLLVCGVPRSGCCSYGVRYLFDYYLNKRVKDMSGIILCEPTNMNLFLGHKGRMEYEIIVKVHLSEAFSANRGVNMLGTMFPLIHELETFSRTLPANAALGNPSLKIKDVHFCGTRPREQENEFKVIVDRTFVPEELEENILERAKLIATTAYKGQAAVDVQTAVAQKSIDTISGAHIVSAKGTKPWMIEAYHPFILKSLGALNDAGYKAGCGHWKNSITSGAYTFGELGIPTFGFGPHTETPSAGVSAENSLAEIKKAVYGQALMIHRNIGIPSFGWSSDEI